MSVDGKEDDLCNDGMITYPNFAEYIWDRNGVRSAVRNADAAYWASWSDALEMIHQRIPAVATDILNDLLNNTPPVDGCLAELLTATNRLDRQGFISRPSWGELIGGLRPESRQDNEPGEFQHGWQYQASTCVENFFRTSTIFNTSTRAQKAHLRSHAGPFAGSALVGAPTAPEFTIEPHIFRCVLLERLFLPLFLSDDQCEGCGRFLDVYGFHRGNCTKSGRLKARSIPTEIMGTRICREAGARIRTNAFLRDMNVGVEANDQRRIEILASGLPLFHGAQLAIDVTLRNALTMNGDSRPRAAEFDGIVADGARTDKKGTYPELANSRRCHLVVWNIECGGRWSSESVSFLQCLAAAKARSSPSYLRRATELAFTRRWSRMMSIACAKAFATSLVAGSASSCVDAPDGACPDFVDLFARA